MMKPNSFKVILCLLLIFCLPVGVKADWWNTQQKCQILDVPSEPIYKVYVGIIPESSIEDYGETTVIEIGGAWDWLYFRDVLWGDIETAFYLDSIFFLGSTDLDLPDQLAGVYLNADWTKRMADGTAWKIGARPGLYSDVTQISDKDVFMLCSLSFVKAFNSKCSGILGVELRPGFERTLMPLVGLECEIGNSARLEAKIPRSKLEYFLSPEWTTHLGLEWRNRSFRAHEDMLGNPDLVTLDDLAGWWGLTYRVSDELHVFADIGRVFNRSLEFSGQESGSDSKVDIGSAVFAKFAIGGPF